MCPACIATMALILAGATSTGGLTAIVVRKLQANTGVKKIGMITDSKGEENDHTNREQDRASESCFAS